MTDTSDPHAAICVDIIEALARCVRRGLWEYCESVAVGADPATITPSEFELVEDDLRALVAVNDYLGHVSDYDAVDTAFVDACIDEWARRKREDKSE